MRTPDERARDVVEAAMKMNLACTDTAVTLKTDSATVEVRVMDLDVVVTRTAEKRVRSPGSSNTESWS